VRGPSDAVQGCILNLGRGDEVPKLGRHVAPDRPTIGFVREDVHLDHVDAGTPCRAPFSPRTPTLHPLVDATRGAYSSQGRARLTYFDVLRVIWWRVLPRSCHRPLHTNTHHRERLPVPPGGADLAPDAGGPSGEVHIVCGPNGDRGVERATAQITSRRRTFQHDCPRLFPAPWRTRTVVLSSWFPPHGW
jgi:hypothetical protein